MLPSMLTAMREELEKIALSSELSRMKTRRGTKPISMANILTSEHFAKALPEYFLNKTGSRDSCGGAQVTVTPWAQHGFRRTVPMVSGEVPSDDEDFDLPRNDRKGGAINIPPIGRTVTDIGVPGSAGWSRVL